MKKNHSHFSQRKFAEMAGYSISSSSFLPAVISGKRNLGKMMIPKFARALGLNKREKQYFEFLVQLNQSRDKQSRHEAYLELTKFHGSIAKTLSREELKFFESHLHSQVWNYFGMDKKEKNTSNIAKRIYPEADPKQVEESITLLRSLGLLQKNANGFTPTNRHISTPMESHSQTGKNYMNNLIDISKKAFREIPPENRQYNSLTFTVSKKGFNRIKGKMKEIQEEIRQCIEDDSEEDRIYTILFSLFPGTKPKD